MSTLAQTTIRSLLYLLLIRFISLLFQHKPFSLAFCRLVVTSGYIVAVKNAERGRYSLAALVFVAANAYLVGYAYLARTWLV